MAPTTIGLRVDEDLATALNAEAERTGASISDLVRAPLRSAYVHDRPSYGPRSPHSFVRDSWALLSRGATNDGAEQRLAQFRDGLANGRVEFGVNTGNASQVIGPAYQPLVADPTIDRPLLSLATVLPLENPSPFAVPGSAAVTGLGPHVEGVNPAGGSLAMSGGNVGPRGYSGVFDTTRELADSANPAVDAIALDAMYESYVAQTEAAIATELATLTAAATTTTGNAAVAVSQQITRMVNTRRRRATAAVVSAAGAVADVLAAGLDERSGDESAQWRVQGCGINLSPDLGATTGQVVVAVSSSASMWAWESAGKRFEWSEVIGPASIRFALFQYFAVRIVRPTGVRVLTVS